MKQFLTTIICLLVFTATCIHGVHAQSCMPPQNLTSEMHNPEWYNVRLNWDAPNEVKNFSTKNASKGVIFDNGPFITHPGEGFGGADVSKLADNGTITGGNINRASNYSMADDFTLTSNTYISNITFYGFQTGSSTTSTFTGVYLRIYNGKPSAGGQVVWGNLSSNLLEETSFSGVYRTTKSSGLLDTSRPIMSVKAGVNATFQAGTYWVEISAVGSGSSGPYIVPVTIVGQDDTGNAMFNNQGSWSEFRDYAEATPPLGTNGHLGISFVVSGYPEGTNYVTGYNVYRNGVKLTATPITQRGCQDLVSGPGTYNYDIKAVWSDNCESAAVSTEVVMPLDPCSVSADLLNLEESFDDPGFPLNCWRFKTQAPTTIWKRVTTGTNPICEPHSGAGMLRFNSYNYEPGNSGLVISPLFSTPSGNAVHSVSFWMYREAEYTNNEDRVNVYLSSTPDLSGATLVKTVHRSRYLSPMVSSGGWYEYRAPINCTGMQSAYVIFEGISGYGNNIYIDDVLIGDICDPVSQLTHAVSGKNITLNWTAPEANAAFDSYTIYRNGTAIATGITTTSYTDENLSNGVYTYGIKAIYNNICGESSIVESNAIFITNTCGNQPKNVASALHNPNWYNITISWQAPDNQSGSNVLGYYICRDGQILNENIITTLSHTDLVSGQGNYTYGVTAVWDNACTSVPAEIVVNMPASPCDAGISQFPYMVNFDEGATPGSNSNSIPNCWTQQYVTGTTPWLVWEGSISVPNTAHSGTYKAYFGYNQYNGGLGATTKLISPKLDLSSVDEPVLNFWHAQSMYTLITKQDTLRIYYKNAENADWALLVAYTQHIPDWTERILPLPNPSATYWIAFEGATAAGRGVMLDDITIRGGGLNGCNAPQNLTSTLHQPEWYNIRLNWDAPEPVSSGASVLGYKIFRNDVQLNSQLITSLTYTDLATSEGTYDYYVQAVWNNSCEAATGSISVVMDQIPCDIAITDFPFTEGFEGNAFPHCWTQEHVKGTTVWKVNAATIGSPNNAHGGTYKANFLYNAQGGGRGATTKLILPLFDLSGEVNPTLDFWFALKKFTTNQDTLRIYYKNSSEAGWTLLAEFKNDVSMWTHINLELPNPTASYQVAFEGIANNGYGVMLDDITITGEETSECNMPRNLAVTLHDPTWFNVKLTWDIPEDQEERTVSGYDIYRNDVKLNNDLVTSLEYLDLVPGKGDYNYYVVAIWDDECVSLKARKTITVTCTPITSFPYEEGFEAGVFDECWTQEFLVGTTSWKVIPKNTGTPAGTHSGNYKVRYLYSASEGGRGATTKLIMPMFDISSLSNPMLHFWHTQRNTSTNQDTLRIYYKNLESASWTLLQEYNNAITAWTADSILLPNPSSAYQIAFEGIATNSAGIMLDDLTIKSNVPVVVCNPPTALVSTVTESTVALAWTAPAEGTPTGYKVFRNNELQGTVTTTTFSQENVANGTYNYCVKAVYEACESEDACTEVTVNVLPLVCDPPQNVAASSIDNTVSLTWEAPEPPYEGGWIQYYTGTSYAALAGGGNKDTIYIACRWTPEDLARMGGFNLTTVKYYCPMTLARSGADYSVQVWQGGTSATDPGTLVYDGAVEESITSMKWYELPLATPVTIDPTKELWIGMKIRKKISCNPAGRDAGQYTDGRSNLMRVNSGAWSNMRDILGTNYRYNWLIGGLLESASGRSMELTDPTPSRAASVTAYNIYRDDLLLTTTTDLTYTDTNVAEGNHEYCISAIYSNNCESAMACDEVEVKICIAPTALVPTVTESTVALAWTAPAEGTPTGYKVFRNDELQETVTTTTFTQENVENGTYNYCVKAVYEACESEEVCASVEVNVAIPTYTITATAGENGSIDPEGEITVNEGDNQTFTITADNGYEVDQLLVDNVNIADSIAGGSYTFKNVTEDHIIAVTFKLIPIPTYTITATAGENGSIDPEGEITVTEGDDQTFTITPNEGYKIAQVLVDGVNNTEAVASGSYTFTNVTAAHTIEATFEQRTYIITATAGENGTVDPDGNVIVNYGDDQTFTFTPNEGYKIAQVLVDGINNTEAVASGSYTFTNVTAAHTIEATFKSIDESSFTLTVNYGSGGKVSPNGIIKVEEGENKTFTIMPNNGYKINQVLIDGVNDEDAVASGVYTFEDVTDDHSLVATFTYISGQQYFITASSGTTGGVISPNGKVTVMGGDDYMFTITPNAGYKIKEVLVDGVNNPTAVEAGYYIFENISASHTIVAKYEKQSFTITASVDGIGGTITPAGETVVTYDGSKAYVITSQTGYMISEVLIDGVNDEKAVSSGKYTFKNVMENHTIVVSFKPRTYEITATAGDGGTIAPEGISTITYGSSVTYDIVADAGYKIKAVMVDGKNNSAAVNSGVYTFSNVTAKHTIAVTFTAISNAPMATGDPKMAENNDVILKVYPNPTVGTLNIESGALKMNDVKVFDITGRLVLEVNNIDHNETKIDLSNYADGVYFIRVDGKTTKVIKR